MRQTLVNSIISLHLFSLNNNICCDVNTNKNIPLKLMQNEKIEIVTLIGAGFYCGLQKDDVH